MMQPWHFEIGVENGPDWFLDIVVKEKVVGLLKKTVRGVEMQGFRFYEAIDKRCQISHRIGCFDWYIDEHNFSKLVENVEGRAGTNMYVFHSIVVDGRCLQIFRGFSGYDKVSIQNTTEMIMLEAILNEPSILVQSWHIHAGGDGYSSVSIAQGKTGDEMRKYLLV